MIYELPMSICCSRQSTRVQGRCGLKWRHAGAATDVDKLGATAATGVNNASGNQSLRVVLGLCRVT